MMQRRVKHFITLIFCGILLLFQVACSIGNPLPKGDKAPLFSTEASLNGKSFEFSLKEAMAKGPVVLYFFPSAYTKGCDLEAHTFSEMKTDFENANTTIIGVSADDINRLNDFSADPDFCAGNFAVASDPDGKIAKKYGLKPKSLPISIKDSRGDKIDHDFIPRVTFVIDTKGKIVEVFSKKDGISPDEHVTKSLEVVEGI